MNYNQCIERSEMSKAMKKILLLVLLLIMLTGCSKPVYTAEFVEDWFEEYTVADSEDWDDPYGCKYRALSMAEAWEDEFGNSQLVVAGSLTHAFNAILIDGEWEYFEPINRQRVELGETPYELPILVDVDFDTPTIGIVFWE